jgi:hypothetical protein
MTSVMGAGAVAGGLIAASRNRVRRRGLAISAIGWGVAIRGGARAEHAVGVRRDGLRRLRQHLVQLTGKDRAAAVLLGYMRGRVMALWAVAWLGSTPIGGPIVGWAGEEFGARWSLIIGGVPTLVAGIVTYPILARVDRRRSEREALEAEAAVAAAPEVAGG